MDFYDIFLHLGLITTVIVAYLIVFRRSTPIKLKGNYMQPATLAPKVVKMDEHSYRISRGNYRRNKNDFLLSGEVQKISIPWNYELRVLIARLAVKQWKGSLTPCNLEEVPRTDLTEGWDYLSLRTSSTDGVTVLLGIRKICAAQPIAEVTIYVRLADGTSYKLPQHPKTAVSQWDSIAGGWSAGGLKIQVLEPLTGLRIIFNGLLTRNDGTKQHVRFNFIWGCVSRAVRHPHDWEDRLAAQALALEPWRDQKWPFLLGKHGEGSWLQWGAIQGRFTAYDSEGAIDRTEYLETRGVKERSWSPQGYRGLRRSVTVTVISRDGTAVVLRGFSYKDVLTVGFNGNVRLPDYSVQSVTGTTFVMSEFCEHPNVIPRAYTFNVSTKKRDFTIVLNISAEGGDLFSGVPHRYRTVYRCLSVSINGEIGTGILELGYAVTDEVTPLRLTPAPVLKWASERDVASLSYCVWFEDRAAACPAYVGGKGASLSLLASVQKELGYRVPPGFCITTKALEEHLEVNPDIKKAIQEIESANENYSEKNFKEKCERTVELFANSDIIKQVKDEIVVFMKDLRQKSLEQNFGPELRFAVRSSGVGEDGEALSAAGQNDTVLGCCSDDEVTAAVRKCWASMFAFTSAHYRRQNGQPCMCGGGVVVQVLVRPKAAGVMFTRHPDNGDPTRILITANYGLGESVVSGTVEPDTIIVTRGDDLIVSQIKLGSKTQRVTATASGVRTEDVPEQERTTPCLSVTEALSLARIGIAQDEMWAAPRDIEWAVTEKEIFLVQARPITSLERWTEEELLHELDFPIMSDDELTTFANTGEVMPKPITALTHDLILRPLEKGSNVPMLFTDRCGYEKSFIVTHNRVSLALFNNIYRNVPNKIDTTLRMLEFSVHGHKVADEYIHKVALHRRETSKLMTFLTTLNTIKLLICSKSCMKDAINVVKSLKFNMETKDPETILGEMTGSFQKMARCMGDHCVTTSASVSSQIIAMLMLVEGAEDFTPEQCSEMNSLLSCGDVVSAEVPQALDRITRMIHESGKVEEFSKINPKEARKWLRVHLPKVYQEVEIFLDKHGYRAIMEFDLITKPWVMVPEEMMEVLQNMKPSPVTTKNPKNDDDILNSLQTPKKPNTRKVLRWLLPLCRRTVQHREHTKAHVILGVHKLRLLVRRLGRILQTKWYLPDEELIFHFRVNELHQYIRTRDPSLLKKAQQRRQYLGSWSRLRFSELNRGWLRPLADVTSATIHGDVTLEATAVCGGNVTARACVVQELSEIHQLQQGDVLITHATDIGWSPYFPLLSGIVTELGGLVSHGAVIAREYGLPCIIGAVGATEIFKTGDMVRLSGANGTIERIQIIDSSLTDAEVQN